MKKNLLLYFLFLLTSSAAWSQYATVRGFVYEAETGEPLMFNNVYLQGTTFGTTTNVDGYYAIGKLPAGIYQLTATSIGFDTLSKEITVKAGKTLNQKIYLEKEILNPHPCWTDSKAPDTVQTSVQKISREAIEKLPTIGSEADLKEYLRPLGCWSGVGLDSASVQPADSSISNKSKHFKTKDAP